MKITSKDQALREIDHTKHPNYDEVCKKMRKLLGSASSFIPDAAEGLRQDWYPEISQEQIKHDNEARNDIRKQILADWSHEQNRQGAWTDLTIQTYFPNWLRNPNKQTADYLESAMANLPLNRKYREQVLEMQEQKPAIERLVTKLPDPIVLPEDIPEQEEEPIKATSLGGPTLQPEKKLPTPIESYEQIVKAAEKIWTPMTGKDRLIVSDAVDVLIEHIKPTRTLRLRLFKGLDVARSNHLTMVLIWLDKLIQDTLKDCLEINKERSDEISK